MGTIRRLDCASIDALSGGMAAHIMSNTQKYETEPAGVKMTRRPWRHWIALAAGLVAGFLVAPVYASSQPSPYVATNWQTEQGLPQNSVYDIIQDHEGYLWLATAAGIVRFDG